MSNRKQLLITYDYELYLGNRSGLISECMIEPTNQLIQVMKPYGIHAVFFADTTYLLKLKEQAATNKNCAADFDTIANQLNMLVSEGHYVFPHIHPHWLDAEYNSTTNQWKLNSIDKYRFHNINDAERSKVFNGSFELLKDILKAKHPDYKVNGYRAGGWCIQPFGDFQPYFERNNVKYEFSVLSGIYQFADAQFFDFSGAPAKTIYAFADDVCTPQADGKFIQYSISSIKVPAVISFAEKIWLKILFRLLKDHTFNKGQGQPSKTVSESKPSTPGGKNISSSEWERIAVELLTAVKLPLYNSYLEKNDYMHFISHPKMITNHNLSIFGKFLKKAYDKFEIETDFHKMKPL
jgi:hypothetical protein